MAGNFVLKQPEKTPTATPEATATATAEVAEPPSTQPFNIENYIKEVFGKNADVALAVAKAESGLDPLQVNDNPKTKDYSVGLYQINLYGRLKESRPSEEWLKDAKNNIDYAKSMFDSQGWQPWSAYKNGHYKRYL